MRNPEIILNTLSSHSKVSDYKYERIYRILFNEEMFMLAYERIKSKPGNMTPGTDGLTIDGMTIDRIGKLIECLKDESYSPQPAKRVYIPKKNGKKRPLGIPTIEDKLVQEVTRMILEAIYEGHFESTSHGFRPFKSCHTALISIKKTFTGMRWFIEGDIKGFFDNIHHATLIDILRMRIADERFIRLIWKFLRAGCSGCRGFGGLRWIGVVRSGRGTGRSDLCFGADCNGCCSDHGNARRKCRLSGGIYFDE